MPRLLRERRAIQATARIDAKQFAAVLTSELDSAFLGPFGRSQILNTLLRTYWRAARTLL